MDSSLITKLRRKLNLEQMTSLCSGENNWETKSYEALGIPKVVMSDGPHGLRVETEKEEGKIGVGDSLPATCFPPATLAACSFDESLIREMAVSYTHLQSPEGSLGVIFRAPPAAVRVSKTDARPLCCLLYTSRCV